jgi:phenylpropionate dioxygenase-like ring-hydroxylating dioxygenase large terminal subunit
MVAITRVTESVQTPAEKAPEPDMGDEVIPRERYISKDFMDLEWERMWTKVWLIGCREDQIPEPGDYMTTEIGKESLLITRGEDGQVNAMYNVCNHRGNQVKFDKMGSAKTLRCAYHMWEYALDGTLINVPDEEDFVQGCPSDRLSLKKVQADTWGGFVWFCMDPNGISLTEFLGMVPEHLDPYRFEDMAMVMNQTVEWDCNWKTSVDAFNEVYHVQAIHPELAFSIDDVDVQIDLYERHNRYLVPFQTYSPRLGYELDEVPEAIAMPMQAIGMDPESYNGKVADVRVDMQKFKRDNEGNLGRDYSMFNDDQLTDDYHYNIFPNLTMNIHADSMMLFIQRPHATDPNKMLFDMQMFVQLPDGAERPAPVDHEQFKHGERSLGLVLDQDSVNLPHVQIGLNSDAYEGYWISRQERRIRHMHVTLMDYINGKYANDA